LAAWLFAAALGQPAGAALAQPAPAESARRAGPIAVDSLPGWQRDALDGLADALARQCALRSPPQPWPALCPELGAASASAASLRAWIERRFEAWPLAGDNGDPVRLITGYHE